MMDFCSHCPLMVRRNSILLLLHFLSGKSLMKYEKAHNGSRASYELNIPMCGYSLSGNLLQMLYKMTGISIKQTWWWNFHKLQTFHRLPWHSGNPKNRLNCPLHAIVSLIFLYLWGLLLTEYFTSILDQPNSYKLPLKRKKKKKKQHVYFAFQFPGCAPTLTPLDAAGGVEERWLSNQTMWDPLAALVPLVLLSNLVSEDCWKE